MSDQAADAPSHGTLADKLNCLFSQIRPADEDREYTGREVVAAVNASGTELSASHLSELRRGIKSNPTLRVLQALAAFFGVRVAYLLDDPDAVREVHARFALRSAMRDAEVQDIAHRVAGLTAQQRTAFDQLLTEIVREHADPPDGPPGLST